MAVIGYFACLAVVLIASHLVEDEVATIWTGGLAIVGLSIIGMAVTWRDNRALLGWPRIGWRGALASGLAVGGILALVSAAATQWPWLFIDLVAPYHERDMSLGRALFDIAVLPAIGEEILFRGVIVTALAGTFSRRIAVVVSSMLFATIHLTPLSFIHLTALGLVLGMVRVRSRSVYPCMLLHGLYNGIVVLLDW
jgi:membrane protease YdiL (CAAX protease family)